MKYISFIFILLSNIALSCEIPNPQEKDIYTSDNIFIGRITEIHLSGDRIEFSVQVQEFFKGKHKKNTVIKFNTSRGMCGLHPRIDASYLYFYNDEESRSGSHQWPLGYKAEVIDRVKAYYAKNH